MGGAGVMDVECPLDLRFTARSIESWLLRGGWDAPTAETTSRLATGHVRDRDRWVLLGLGPAPESIPVAPPTAFAGSRDGAVRVDVSRRYVAWGRMWARMPGAPVRDVWQGRAAWTEEVYARHRDQMWGNLLVAAAAEMAVHVALGQHVGHATVQTSVNAPARIVEALLTFQWAPSLDHSPQDATS